jgi:hypothetical protein
MQCLTSISGQNEENEVTSRNKIVVAVAEIFLVLFRRKVSSSCLGIIIDVLPQRQSIGRSVCMIQKYQQSILSFFITVVVAFLLYAV